MKTVKVSFPESDLVVLDSEASALGIARTELIRKKVAESRAIAGKTLSPADYNKIVSKAQKRMGSVMSKAHIEQVVSYTFRCLNEL